MDIFQFRKNLVLQVGRGGFTQTNMIENLVFVGISGHGLPAGVRS